MKKQRGGFFLGLIVGLLAGLALALGVAVAISKGPMPFINKVPHRTAEQDAAEAERNKNWDPNAALQGRNPARPQSSSSGVIPLPPAASTPPAPVAPAAPASAPTPRDPAAILGENPPAEAAAAAASSTKPAADPLTSYFVQAGAFSREEDAEAQRGKLALLGLSAKITEREQAGRTVYRVRVGPFNQRDAALAAKQKLEGGGIESSLIQVQK